MAFSYSAFASAACFSKLAFSFAPSPFHRADSSFVTGPKSFTPSSFCTASLFAWRYRKYAVIAFLGSSVAAMASGWKRRGQRTQWILGQGVRRVRVASTLALVPDTAGIVQP